MSGIFDQYYKKYDNWYERNKFAYFSELGAIRKALPKKGKGLEIGVGTGRFAASLGIRFGIDPSRNMVEIAKQRGVDARVGVGEDLPFKGRAFDYVAIIITLSFVKDPEKVLKEAKRVLKRNGRLVIGIIDKDSFLGKFYQRKKGIFYKKANFLSVEEVADLLKTMGFKRFSYYQTISTFPDRMSLIEEPKKGFGKGAFVVISAQEAKEVTSKIYRKFGQYERIRFLFKRNGYDMEKARSRVLDRAGGLKEPVLDVGTGPGRMAYTLARAGYKLTTIDISKEAQKVARIYAQKYKVLDRIKFMNMDAQNIKFKNGSFATVISANLLHDVNNPKRVVREMIRVAKPEAKIIISDLNKKGRDLVNKVYRLNSEVHRGKLIDLEKVVGGTFRKMGISFKRYKDGYITTYVGEKI